LAENEIGIVYAFKEMSERTASGLPLPYHAIFEYIMTVIIMPPLIAIFGSLGFAVRLFSPKKRQPRSIDSH
jgi:hypothetical protein